MKFGCKQIVGVWTAGWATGVAASGLLGRIENSAALSTRAYLEDRHALQLVSVTEAKGNTPGSFKFHRENLEKVMSTVETGIPVAIISVAGAFRSGKSFLLSLFLRSLEGHNIDTSDKSFLGGFDGDADGFPWKAGIEPHTQGMTVWSKPHYIYTSVGRQKKKMAVLLVDTQGTFDHATSTQIHGSLFGLSTTLSSCQIYNVKGQVQTNNLDSLALFLEYAQRAKELEGVTKVEHRPFQRLEFLIRDWGNWGTSEDPTTVHPEVLRERSLKYLDGILKTKDTTDNKKITGSFRDRVGSFALPFPGSQVAAKSFKGDISQIDVGFRQLVQYYLRTIILGKLTGTKLPNAKEAQFVDSVEEWVNLYNSFLRSGDLPDAGTYVEFLISMENMKHRTKLMEEFKVDADKSVEAYVDPAKLKKELTQYIERSLRNFSPRGDEKTRKKARAELRRDAETEAERIKKKNIQRRGMFVDTMSKMKANIRNFYQGLTAKIFDAVFTAISMLVVGVCSLVILGLALRPIFRALVTHFLLYGLALCFVGIVIMTGKYM